MSHRPFPCAATQAYIIFPDQDFSLGLLLKSTTKGEVHHEHLLKSYTIRYSGISSSIIQLVEHYFLRASLILSSTLIITIINYYSPVQRFESDLPYTFSTLQSNAQAQHCHHVYYWQVARPKAPQGSIGRPLHSPRTYSHGQTGDRCHLPPGAWPQHRLGGYSVSSNSLFVLDVVLSCL